MSRVEPQRHRERRREMYWFPLRSMLLWLVVPAIAVQAYSLDRIPVPTTQPKLLANSENLTPQSPSHLSSSEALRVQPHVVAQSSSGTTCPAPVLSRLSRHRVKAGETLDSIAQRYNLNPVTLRGLNPGLIGLSVPVGRELLISPIDGIPVQVPAGSNWRDIAEAYGVRADVLFEVNGCRQPSQQVFIPAETQASSGRQPADNYTGFGGYPLPSAAAVGLSYGWHENPTTGTSTFHSGIDLLTEEGTPVLVVESGTVAFAGEQGVYGNLVVINHQGGRQTRYAHLSRITVSRGEKVRRGATLGAVGSTGRPDIDKSHLHFEVRYNSPSGWVAQDPELHLPARPTARR